LRTGFEGQICQNLGSLNSQVYVCMQGLSAGEKRTSVSDLNQMQHWVFIDLFILNYYLALLACRYLCDTILSALHSVKLILRLGEQGKILWSFLFTHNSTEVTRVNILTLYLYT